MFGIFRRQREIGEVTHPRYTRDWCLYALLYCSAWSDGVLRPEEEDEVNALLHRSVTLLGITDPINEQYLDEFDAILQGKNSVFELADLACQYLPPDPGLSESVYTHCADIVFSDRKVIDEELEFLKHVAKAMDLPRKTVDDILTVLAWKHAC